MYRIPGVVAGQYAQVAHIATHLALFRDALFDFKQVPFPGYVPVAVPGYPMPPGLLLWSQSILEDAHSLARRVCVRTAASTTNVRRAGKINVLVQPCTADATPADPCVPDPSTSVRG